MHPSRFQAASVQSNPLNPRIPIIRGVEKDPEGKSQYSALWLTMSTSLAGKMSVGSPVKLALREAGRDKKVPMCFFYGEKDATAQEHAKDYVRFARESFGALHQMLAGLAPAEREEAWQEISTELARFEGPEGFEGPCELIVAWGV